MYYNISMITRSLPNKRTVCFLVPVFCAFVLLAACPGTNKAVVDTEDTAGKSMPGSTEKPAVKASPAVPVKSMIDLVSVKGGTFRMGNAGNINSRRRDREEMPNSEWPAHNVTIRNFYIGKYEVTQGQFFEVTGERPSNHEKNPDDNNPNGWMKLPVESITWYDTLVFCNRLSVKEKLKPVYSINGSSDPDDWGDIPDKKSAAWDAAEMDVKADGYRLPTEAEWEYAARGGAESGGFIYAGGDNLDQVAWYSGDLGRPPVGVIHEVGKKQPNELGLYDMSGNVMEWCWDWFDSYSADPKNNPVGPSKGIYRVIRGGGWSARVRYCRILYRHNNLPQFIGVNLGFRVVRNAP